MWYLEIAALITVVWASGTPCSSCHGFSSDSHSLLQRAIVTEDQLSPSYDFVIAGGGLAGLVLASRLTEDSKRTVLVLEAGDSGDAVASQINTPSGAYYTSIVGTNYDWKHETTPQQNLNGRVLPWPRGKVLGGSSAMNAMYLVRPAQSEVDAWQNIASSIDSTAAQRWGWNQMYSAMKKAETFTPPLPEIEKVGNISYDASNYGTSGPMHISYPAYMPPIHGNWTVAYESVGISTLRTPNGGTTMGAFITPSSINPSNWTRSYSRSAYIDPLPPRPNLHILVNAPVTRVLFSSSSTAKDVQKNGLTAVSVEYATSADSRRTVNVTKEVLLAGGSLGSPKILMHSGVGPKDVLDTVGVVVYNELPGVGQHLQDHLTAGIVWETPMETSGNIRESQSDFSRTPEFLSFINDAVAFVNLDNILGLDGATAVRSQIINAYEESARTLVPSNYSEVVEGYKAIYNVTANTFLSSSAQIEMLMSAISPGTIAIQSALQHPLSQGRLYINSTNPLDPIVIDPQYFSHPADVIIMRQGLKFVRSVGKAFGAALGNEIWPGNTTQSDEDWENWIKREAAGSQYHPTASCAMLPKSQGGVVDADLKVYGLANVRVIDSSVYPFEFSAHLASVTFGLAEQAADMIKNQYDKSSGTFLRPPVYAAGWTVILFVTVGYFV